MMNKNSSFVKMYSAEWCHDCKAMLIFFEEKNVAYKVYHVDQDQQATDRLIKLCNGKKIVPTLQIGKKVYINPSIEYMKSIVNPISKVNLDSTGNGGKIV
jgi:glutaredoxin